MSFLSKFQPSEILDALTGFSVKVFDTGSRAKFERRSDSLVVWRNTESSQEELLEISAVSDENGEPVHQIDKFAYSGVTGHLRMSWLSNDKMVAVVTQHICRVENIVVQEDKEELKEALMAHLYNRLVTDRVQASTHKQEDSNMSFLKKADPSDLHAALTGFDMYVPGTKNRVRFKRSLNKLTLVRNTESSQETLLEIKHIVDEVGRLLHVVFVEEFDYAGATGHLRMPYLFNEELVGVVIGHICQIEDVVLQSHKEQLEAALMDHLRAQLVGQEAQVYGLDGMAITCYAETGEVAGQLEFRLFGPEDEGLVLVYEDYEGVLATYEQVEPTHHKEMPWTSLRVHNAEGHAGYTGLMTYHDPSAKQVIDILADVIVDKGGARTWEDAVNSMLHYLETKARVEESGELFEESYPMNA